MRPDDDVVAGALVLAYLAIPVGLALGQWLVAEWRVVARRKARR